MVRIDFRFIYFSVSFLVSGVCDDKPSNSTQYFRAVCWRLLGLEQFIFFFFFVILVMCRIVKILALTNINKRWNRRILTNALNFEINVLCDIQQTNWIINDASMSSFFTLCLWNFVHVKHKRAPWKINLCTITATIAIINMEYCVDLLLIWWLNRLDGRMHPI